MIGYPNQKYYIINKKIKEGDVFFMLKWEELYSAARELSPSALKLYMYLAKNKDGYEFFFSSKDFIDTFKISEKSYHNARTELISKGFLKEEKTGNKVHFSSSAAFKETKENLREEFLRLSGILKEQDVEAYDKLRTEVEAAKLKEVQDENIYKIKIKELISFTEELVREFGRKEIEDLC